jgi:branched-chain amino acid transport system permease protein
MQVIATNWDYVGGAVGLTLPMSEQGWGVMVFNTSKLPYYYIAAGLLALTLAAGHFIERSYLGYYFRAIKDEPEAARSLGVNLAHYKLAAIAASSFLTALGGTLYAQKELFIDPGSVMSTSLSIKIALVAILGGVGRLYGPVIGALVLTAIEEGSRLAFGGSGLGTDLIIYSLLIIGIAVFSPEGLLGLVRDFRHARARSAGAAAGAGD